MSEQPAFLSAKGWLGLIVSVVVVLAVPALLRSGDLVRYPFDEAPLRALQASHPDCVLVGDSMLRTRIDPARLNEIADRRCDVLGYPGTATAVWYLIVKNIIARLSPPPHWTIILFRDRQLTLPAMRTEGRYKNGLEPFMLGREPEFQETLEKAQRRRLPVFERLSLFIYPAQKHRYERSEDLHERALNLVSNSATKPLLRDAAKELFDLNNLRNNAAPAASGNNDEREPVSADDATFAASVNGSFLPMILDTAERRHIKLLFFRVKHRPPANAPFVEEEPGARRYQRDLQTYLTKRGAVLFDENREADITLPFYGEGDHVTDTMMRPYTELFWKKIRPLLSNSTAGNSPAEAP